MTIAAPLQLALLGLALAALWASASRLAGATGAAGLDRVLAAAPIAASAACIASLALGLAGIGGEPLALAAAAALGYCAAVLTLPAPAPSTGAQALAGLRAMRPAALVAVAAGAGGGLALVAWFLRHPMPGTDSLANHLPIALEWVQGGAAGSVTLNSYDFPTGAYPLTNELLLAWGMGISRSFVPTTLLAPAMALLLAAAVWAALRELEVPGRVRGIAVAAIVSLPLVAGQLNEAKNDVSATAWTACAMALALAARRRPLLAAPALLAAALAIGTKTTVVPLAILAVTLAGYSARRELKRMWLPLIAAFAAGVVAGGVWYLRNLLDHGSPLWPFVRGPFGDPLPPLLTLLEPSFLDRPRATLEGRADDYVEALAGGLLLAAAALTLPLVGRTRAALAAGGLALLSLILWMQAPITGIGDLPALDDFPIEATRYLLPALAVAAVAVAVAGREKGVPSAVATGVLGVALAWNVVQDAQLGYPQLPRVSTLLAGALLGAIAGAIALASLRRAALPAVRLGPAGAGAAWAAAAALAGAALSPAVDGYTLRHTGTPALDGDLVRRLEAPGRLRESDSVDFVRLRTAMLAGDRLERRLRLLGPGARCDRDPRRWLVVLAPTRTPVRGQPGRLFPPSAPIDRCEVRRPPALGTGAFRAYAPRAP